MAFRNRPPNLELLEYAAPLFENIELIVDGLRGEVADQLAFYRAQRKKLADNEALIRNSECEKQELDPVGYFHSSLTARLEYKILKEDQCQTPRYQLDWRAGNLKKNSPEAVKARGGKIILDRIKRTGRNGNYNKRDFSRTLRRYANWESELAFAFELERFRPIRQYLNYINKLRMEIKWTPPEPVIPSGPIKREDFPR